MEATDKIALHFCHWLQHQGGGFPLFSSSYSNQGLISLVHQSALFFVLYVCPNRSFVPAKAHFLTPILWSSLVPGSSFRGTRAGKYDVSCALSMLLQSFSSLMISLLSIPGKRQSWDLNLYRLSPEPVLWPFHILSCSQPSALRFLSESCWIPEPDTKGAQSTPPTGFYLQYVQARAALPGREVSIYLPHRSCSLMAHALTQVTCIRLTSLGARWLQIQLLTSSLTL